MFEHAFDDAVGAPPVLGDLFEIAVSIWTTSSISARLSSSSTASAGAAVSFSSPNSSTDKSAKLLTKLSGFLISWAMPAVN